MLHVLTQNTKCHQPYTGKWTKLQILLIERVLRLTERDYTHWKGLVVLTCDYYDVFGNSDALITLQFYRWALRFYGAAHLCLCDSELSARQHLDDKTVQLTYQKHILLGRAAVLQVRRTVLSARCSVFRVRCSFTGEVLRFLGGVCIFVSVRLSRICLLHCPLVYELPPLSETTRDISVPKILGEKCPGIWCGGLVSSTLNPVITSKLHGSFVNFRQFGRNNFKRPPPDLGNRTF